MIFTALMLLLAANTLAEVQVNYGNNVQVTPGNVYATGENTEAYIRAGGDVNIQGQDAQAYITQGGNVRIQGQDSDVYIDNGGDINIKSQNTQTASVGPYRVVSSDKNAQVTVGPAQTSIQSTKEGVYVSQAGRLVQVTDEGEAVQVNTGGKQVRIQTAQDVETLFSEKDEIEVSRIQEASPSIEIRPNTVIVGDIRVQSAGKTLKVRSDGQDVEITNENNAVIIKEGGVQVTTTQIPIDREQIKVDGVEVKLPSQAINAQVREKSVKVDLITEEGKPTYVVQTQEKKKMLGIFSVTVNGNVKIDAANGQTLKVETPWWNFLTF